MAKVKNKIKVEPVPTYTDGLGIRKLFGITASQLAMWIQKGLPKAARNTYHIANCVKWHKLSPAIGASNRTDAHINAAEQLVVAKVTKLDRENDLAAGKLIKVEEIENFAGLLGTSVSGAFESLGARLCGPLAGITDPREIQALIWAEAKESRAAIVRELEKVVDDSE